MSVIQFNRLLCHTALIGLALTACARLSAQDATTATAPMQDVRIDLQVEPQTSGTGFAKSYRISSESQFTAGNLADAFLGDYVLESDRLRAVFARPGKPSIGSVHPGSLMDITTAGKTLDYFSALNTSVWPETTGSLAIYTAMESVAPASSQSTAALTMTGYIGDPDQAEPDASELITVATRAEVAPGSPALELTTTLENKTSRSAWLSPADIIDWGEGKVFVERAGFDSTTVTTSMAIGSADDFSLGYFNPGKEKLHGLFNERVSVMFAGNSEIDLATYEGARRTSKDEIGSALPAEFLAAGASTIPGPGLVLFPGTENRLVMGPNGMPRQESIYVPKNRIQYQDGVATLTQNLRTLPQLFETPDDARKANTMELQAGTSYTFTRTLVLGNSNWAPIARRAWLAKGENLGVLAGAVVDGTNGAPLANATVLISGGPTWDEKAAAPAIMQTTTRADGTFATEVPLGSYVMEAVIIGRRQSSPLKPVKVIADKPQITVLQMSREAIVRIAVSEAETPTSSPLPVKVTIQAKPPYADPNFGVTNEVDRGVRNVRYMPQGAGVFPLSPGRYHLVISRGLEYDILEKDIAISPGQELTITGSLPHSMKGMLPGMVSMDAGLLTDASGSAYASAESRAIQAACEGVQLIISGDYDKYTNLQTAIRNTGLEKWVKAFMGRRILLEKDGLAADLFVYPLTTDKLPELDHALTKVKGLPPDIAIADLKKAMPDVIFEISRPLHPEAGYLTTFPFDMRKRQFIDDAMPPQDFSAIQLLEGKKISLDPEVYPRYMAMQLARLTKDSPYKAAPLTPTASSGSRLTYGQEVGYPRTYLYLNSPKDFRKVTESDIISAIRGQHITITNGPVLLFDALDYKALKFRQIPGSIVDLSTTEIIRLRTRILAAPWVGLSNIITRDNGITGVTTQYNEQGKDVLRYPGHRDSTRYLKEDGVQDAVCFSTRTTLEPVVPDPLSDYGGKLFPFAWTGPIFVDRNGDGKVTIPPKEPAP